MEAVILGGVQGSGKSTFRRFNELPNWRKQGGGLYREETEKEGVNPLTGETVTAQRRRVRIGDELPMKEGDCDFIRGLLRRGES
jgi:hypothetical protein